MKNKMMRLASLLMVAVLLTTSVVSGTYAKYVTEGSANDTARVAKWGVELTVDSQVFAKQYAGNSGISVLSSNEDKVIAPGTVGVAAAFSIKGQPEVDAKLTVSLGSGDDFHVVALATGDYTDYTVANPDPLKTFHLSTDYIPVKWTLTRDGNPVAAGSLNDIETYFKNISSVTYEVENANSFTTAVVGDYVLAWEWPFETGDTAELKTMYNKADTYLGNQATAQLEKFKLTIRVEQLD